MKKVKTFKNKSAGNKAFVKKRLYDQISWVEFRIRFLGANPNCYSCGLTARVVDHVIAHKGDEKKFWEPTNLIPLCKQCHDFVTGHFDKHIPPKTEEKMKWLNNNRLVTETSVRVKIVTKER